MGSEAGNLVAQTLATADGNFRQEALIGLEVERQPRVVLLDEQARCLLYRLGSYTTLPKNPKEMGEDKYHAHSEGGRKIGFIIKMDG